MHNHVCSDVIDEFHCPPWTFLTFPKVVGTEAKIDNHLQIPWKAFGLLKLGFYGHFFMPLGIFPDLQLLLQVTTHLLEFLWSHLLLWQSSQKTNSTFSAGSWKFSAGSIWRLALVMLTVRQTQSRQCLMSLKIPILSTWTSQQIRKHAHSSQPWNSRAVKFSYAKVIAACSSKNY